MEIIKIRDLTDLTSQINKDLGTFTDKFRYKRKELKESKSASKRGVLFKYDKADRDWAINEGGGTEVQYHLFYRGDKVGYGLGFNTQYVPFATNKIPPNILVQPFANAFILSYNSELVESLKSTGFKYYGKSIDELESLENNEYYLFGREIQIIDGGIYKTEYELMLRQLQNELFELYCNIFRTRNKLQMEENANTEYVELLEANKNLILTGAPGTGKTYLAKQIAKSMNAETEFVQFHPSYDYTDFVEGLRPTPPDDNGNIGFELKDGVFKRFCKKALKSTISNGVDNFEEAWDKLLLSIKENLSNGNLTKIGSWEYGLSSKDSLKYSSENTPSQYNFTITKQNVYDAYQDKKARPSGAFQKDMVDVVDYMKRHFELKNYVQGAITQNSKNKFVLIIDEINRAEISKVLGELFFSIDPGYRGIDGKVKTQYSNLQDESDVFYDGFYIPENVYIIGTMNDIDRSVESMDFAMRRRFAWKEVTALERISMWNGQIEDWKEKSEKRMIALNNAIEDVQGLSSAYHIGPAYFLKLEKYKDEENPFDQLWENHLKGVIFEYLRGIPNSVEELENLKLAYDLKDDVENI